MSLKNRDSTQIVESALLVLLSSTIARGATFLITLFAARFMDPNLFGRFMLIRSTIGSIDTFAAASVGNLATKNIAASERKGLVDGANSIIFSSYICYMSIGVVALSLFGLRQLFGWGLGWSPFEIRGGELFLSIAILFLCMSASWWQRLIIGRGAFSGLARLSVGSFFVTVLASFVLIRQLEFLGGLVSLCILFGTDLLLRRFFFPLSVSWRFSELSFQHVFREVKGSFSETSRILLATVLSVGTLWFLRVQCVSESADFSDLGEFEVAYQAVTFTMMITGSVTTVGLRAFSLLPADRPLLVWDSFCRVLRLNVLIAATFSIILFVFSAPIIDLFGPKYSEAPYLLKILAGTALLGTFTSVVEKLFLVRNQVRSTILAFALGMAGAVCLMSSKLPIAASQKLAWSHIVFYLITALIMVGSILRKPHR